MFKWIAAKFADGASRQSPQDVDIAAGRALELYRGNELQDAEEMLRRGLASRPSAVLARMLGALYASQNRYDEAIDALNGALQLEPRHAATANLIGLCYSQLSRLEEAAAHYAIALASDPSMADAYLNSGWNSFLLSPPEAGGFFREWLSKVERGRSASETAAPASRLRLDRVTLCCVDCAYHQLAAEALRFTLSGCDFAKALFFSDRDCDVPGVRWVKIDPITSSAQYSNFLIHRLLEYVDTEHLLVIQYDGFVLNPAAWDPHFLDYDYIGAKIPAEEGFIVGNGGFSLRSRKLLLALRADEEIKRYDAFRDRYLEDLAICRAYRGVLESRHGIRFAPESVADQFAAEQVPPTARNFGFHNIVHLVGLHESQFRLPQSASDGALNISFRAQTELGTLTVHRQLELHGNALFWEARPETPR